MARVNMKRRKAMTFQELIDEQGLDNVFLNTSVDLATQNCIQEWFFDYELADEDSAKWLRYFRRRCNEFYPKYKEMVRLMSIKSNVDPFITEFMERVRNSSDLKNTSIRETSSGTKQITYGKIDTKRDSITETPGTSVTETYNSITDRHDRNGGIVNTTEYTNYREQVNGGSSGSSSDTTSGDPYATTDAVHNTGKGRGIDIAYPEANMGSIGMGVDGGINDIGYASSESRNWTEENLGATRQEQHLDTLVESEYDDSNNSTKTITGSYSNTESGIDTNTRTGSKTTAKSGIDQTVKSGSSTLSGTDSIQDGGTTTETGEETNQGQDAEVYQGRHESAVDILPRAIRAIIGSDEIKYLITSLQICFDCYGRM